MSVEMVHCTKCGHENPANNVACTHCGAFLATVPSSPSQKPGKIKFIAISTLVDGIVNIVWGFFTLLTLFGGNFLACIQSPYCILLGVLEIVYAAKLLSNPPKAVRPAKYIAVMQIINVITLNMFGLFVGSLIIGILNLVFYNDAEMEAFFDNIQSDKADDVSL